MQSNLLRAKMTEAGYTQRSLASELKMSPTTLNLTLSGKRKFRLDEAEKICAILSISDPQEKIRIFFP